MHTAGSTMISSDTTGNTWESIFADSGNATQIKHNPSLGSLLMSYSGGQGFQFRGTSDSWTAGSGGFTWSNGTYLFGVSASNGKEYHTSGEMVGPGQTYCLNDGTDCNLNLVATDPSGACTSGTALRYNTADGVLWGCTNTSGSYTWTAVSGLSSSSSKPSTCSVGELWTNPSATSAMTVAYACYPANTWSPIYSTVTSVPTYVIDAGAGSGATASILSGSTDLAGWVQVVVSSVGTASAGIVTLTFGNASLFSAAPKCSISAGNAAAAALSGASAPYVSQSTTTASNFVITGGSTAVGTGTYLWGYTCRP